MNNNLIDFYNEIKQATHAYCVKEQGQFQGGLESFDQYIQRHENQSVETVKEYIETCKQSFQLIISELLAARDEAAIQELIQAVNRVKAGVQSSDENKQATLKNIFGLSTVLLEKIYQTGLNCMNSGCFEDAEKVFSLLLLLDPGYSATWVMLGIAYERKKKWTESAGALEMAMQIDPKNPLPYVHAALCYRELGRTEDAANALKNARKCNTL